MVTNKGVEVNVLPDILGGGHSRDRLPPPPRPNLPEGKPLRVYPFLTSCGVGVCPCCFQPAARFSSIESTQALETLWRRAAPSGVCPTAADNTRLAMPLNGDLVLRNSLARIGPAAECPVNRRRRNSELHLAGGHIGRLRTACLGLVLKSF